MIEPLPCPFCGKLPKVYLTNLAREGDAFGEVRCENLRCFANPVVNDGAFNRNYRGTGKYKDAAIRRWNRRK